MVSTREPSGPSHQNRVGTFTTWLVGLEPKWKNFTPALANRVGMIQLCPGTSVILPSVGSGRLYCRASAEL